MNGLLLHWWLALMLFRPQFFMHFLVRACRNFYAALVTPLIHFGWFFVFDVIAVSFFGTKIVDFMLKALTNQKVQLHPLLSGSMFMVGLTTFLMQVLFVLFLRRDHFLLNPKTYLQTYVFKYVQFVFFVSLASASFKLLLLACDMPKMPDLPEIILSCIKAFELLALFFWLDSAHTLKSFMRSFERATNLFFYSLPVILGISLISLMMLSLLFASCFGVRGILDAPYAYSSFIEFFVAFGKSPTVWQLLLIKYGRFMIDGMTMALLYTWYRRKRSVVYASQLFDDAEAA